MDEDRFNMEVRKFLKKLGVTSQREIEDAVRKAVESGTLKGDETLSAKAVVTVSGVDVEFTVDGEIALS
jgi:hypothetical protein